MEDGGWRMEGREIDGAGYLLSSILYSLCAFHAPPVFQQRPLRSMNRVRLRQWNPRDVLIRARSLLRPAVVHIPFLAHRICAHHTEVAARSQIFVRDSRRNDEHIAGIYFLFDAALAP